MTQRLAYKEFRSDGWPFCPNCEEDELYSYLMLNWTQDTPPTVEQCIAAGMQCYACNWKSSGMNAFGNKCFQCGKFFTTPKNEPDYVYCCECRINIRDARERDRIRAEVEAMEWPDVIGA